MPAPALLPAPPPLGDEEPSLPPNTRNDLSGLEHALIVQMGTGFEGIRGELREIRGEITRSTRLHIGAFVLLWLLTVFSLAVVALKDGVDPRTAAEAVQIVTPASR